VRNPLRSEAEAFRFLVLSIVGFAAIAIASVAGGPWAGIPVAVIVTLGAIFLYFRRGEKEAPVRTAPTRRHGEDERRILVVANETVGGEKLREEIRKRSEGVAEHVLVVTPALNSPLRHWASDDDNARAAAQKRLDRSLARLREAGIDAEGEIGDSDPLQAMEDALRTFGADEVIISTHPEGRSNWLERGVVDAARERFALRITHVVVDLEREREEEEVR
jgi:hypothetical protein